MAAEIIDITDIEVLGVAHPQLHLFGEPLHDRARIAAVDAVLEPAATHRLMQKLAVVQHLLVSRFVIGLVEPVEESDLGHAVPTRVLVEVCADLAAGFLPDRFVFGRAPGIRHGKGPRRTLVAALLHIKRQHDVVDGQSIAWAPVTMSRREGRAVQIGRQPAVVFGPVETHSPAADFRLGTVSVDERQETVLARQLVVGHLLFGPHLLHGFVPNIAVDVIFLRQREIPHLERDVKAVAPALPSDLQVARVMAWRRGAGVVGHEEINPECLVLLLRDVVVEVGNGKGKAG